MPIRDSWSTYPIEVQLAKNYTKVNLDAWESQHPNPILEVLLILSHRWCPTLSEWPVARTIPPMSIRDRSVRPSVPVSARAIALLRL
jgi:hypothetical protein